MRSDSTISPEKKKVWTWRELVSLKEGVERSLGDLNFIDNFDDVSNRQDRLSEMSETRFGDPTSLELLIDLGTRLTDFMDEENPRKQLLSLQIIAQRVEYLSQNDVSIIATRACKHKDPSIRREVCYLLGRAGQPYYIKQLLLLIKDQDNTVRDDAERAISKISQNLNTNPEMNLIMLIQSIQQLQIHNLNLLENLIETIEYIKHQSLGSTGGDYVNSIEGFEICKNAFKNMLPYLEKKYQEGWVTFCNGEMICSGQDRIQVVQKAMSTCPGQQVFTFKIGIGNSLDK